MARAIDQFLATIRQAIYGRDVREAIASGIEQCYDDSTASAQKADIEAKGAEVLASIPDTYEDLQNNVDDLKSAYIQNDAYNTGTRMIVFERGVQISTPAVGETIGDINARVTNAAAKCAIVACTPGQVFTVNLYGGSGARGWAFTDTTYTVLRIAESGLNTRNRQITAPSQAAWLILNNVNNAVVDLPCYSGTLIIDRVNENKEDIATTNDISNSLLYDGFKRGIVTGSFAPVDSTAYKYKLFEKSKITKLYALFNNNYHVFYKVSLFAQDQTRLWMMDTWTEVENAGELDLSKLSEQSMSNAYYIGVTILYSNSTTPTPIEIIPLTDMYLANTWSESAAVVSALRNNGIYFNAVVDATGKHGYTSVNDAVDNTIDGDIILIMPGVYYEDVRMWGKNRSLIGVDKEKCVIRSDTGEYATPALEANIGTFRNITFVSGAGNHTEDTTEPKSYAVHIDYPWPTPFKIIFDNCDFVSYLNAGVGIGCRYNQTIIFNNCTFETRASKIYSGTLLDFIPIGGLLFHNDSIVSSTTGQGSLILNNCEIKGVTKAIMAQSVNNDGKTMTVRFNKCLAYKSGNSVVDIVGYWGDESSQSKGTSPYFVGDKVILDSLSYGNNSPEIDFANYWS